MWPWEQEEITEKVFKYDVDNEPAIRLYRDKIGFESILYSIDEYGKGEDRFTMELNLAELLERNKKK